MMFTIATGKADWWLALNGKWMANGACDVYISSKSFIHTHACLPVIWTFVILIAQPWINGKCS